MLAALLHLKIRQYSVSQIMQVLDAMVVLAGASVFGLGSAFVCDDSDLCRCAAYQMEF